MAIRLRFHHVVYLWVLSVALFFILESSFIEVLPGNNDLPPSGVSKMSVQPKMEPVNLSNRTDLRELLAMILKQHSELYSNHSKFRFNVEASNNIPLDREIPDLRPEKCRSMVYEIKEPVSVSVVIIFHNDALTMILRTVHSIINNSPPSMLKEIILVDDVSHYSDLGGNLYEYISKLSPKVRIIRNSKREGLVRSRLNGSNNATGDILVFFDAHMECGVGWLEPLVYELQQNKAIAVQPHVDQISASDISYFTSDVHNEFRSGISWDLGFVWYSIPKYLQQIRQSPEIPFPTPTLVGCAIAVWKSNFDAIGKFDGDLNIWGGEHIEFSFRTWLCRGRVLTIPCSRVGHLFKNFAYSFNADPATVIIKNIQRVANLWLGEYLWIYQSATHSYAGSIETTLAELASLAKRREFLRQLKCNNFSWFLESVIPELPIPSRDTVHFGEIFHTLLERFLCLSVTDIKFISTTMSCSDTFLSPRDTFTINARNEFLHFHECVYVDNSTGYLKVDLCSRPLNNTWTFSDATGLLSVSSAQGSSTCATLEQTNLTTFIKMNPCNGQDLNQMWNFRYRQFFQPYNP